MDKEIARVLAIEAIVGGGFTSDLEGNLVKDGYSVSIFPELERKVPSIITTAIAREIEEYANHDILAHPSVYLGCWLDGHYILDCVALAHNQRAARHLAALYHQRAYYNIKEGIEVRMPIEQAELAKRFVSIPETKEVKLVHYAKIRLSVLDGRLRGQNGGEEGPRLDNAIPAVYLYKEDVEPERCIKTRPWVCKVTANLALLDLDDTETVLPLLAEVKAKGSFLSAAEWAIYNAGYDGYTDSNGKVVVFHNITIDTCERSQ